MARKRVILSDGRALSLYDYKRTANYRLLDTNQRFFFMAFVCAHYRSNIDLDRAVFTFNEPKMKFQLQFALPAASTPSRDNMAALVRLYDLGAHDQTRLSAFCQSHYLATPSQFGLLVRQLHEVALQQQIYQHFPDQIFDQAKASQLVEQLQQCGYSCKQHTSFRYAVEDHKHGFSI